MQKFILKVIECLALLHESFTHYSYSFMLFVSFVQTIIYACGYISILL